MDLEDLIPSRLVGQGDLDLSIDSPWPEEGRVEDVGSVGSHNDLDLPELIEPIHLVEELHQGSLDLTIRGVALGQTTASDGVDLVDEDDTRLVGFGVL